MVFPLAHTEPDEISPVKLAEICKSEHVHNTIYIGASVFTCNVFHPIGRVVLDSLVSADRLQQDLLARSLMI